MNLIFFLSIGLTSIYPYETPMVKYTKPAEMKHEESGLKRVDCIYVINLKRRSDRWKRMKEIGHHHGIQVNRFDAVDCRDLNAQIFEEISGKYGYHCKPGVVGCLLSHLSVIKDARERGFQTIWILEDDAEALVDDLTVLDEVIEEFSNLDPSWDVLFTDQDRRGENGYQRSVGSHFRPDLEHPPLIHFLKRKRVSANLYKIGQRFGTHSSVVSASGIEKLYEFFSHVYSWSAIDVDMHCVPGIREYCTSFDIVSNIIDTDSDITWEK